MQILNGEWRMANSGRQKSAVSCSFSLSYYLCVVFGLSWPFLIASALWAKSLTWSYLLNSTGMVMVTMATVLAGKYLFQDNFANAGWSWGKQQHYLGVLALIVLLWLPSTLGNLLMGQVHLPLNIQREQLIWIVVLLIGTLIPGFGEEFGWRGYLLPRLAQRVSVRRAVLLHSLIWWVWHWPVLIGATVPMIKLGTTSNLPNNPFLAIALVLLAGACPAILHGVIFAWIWWRTRSLALATLYHALYDGVRDSLAMTIGVHTNGSNGLADLWPTVVICLLGLFLLWKGNWQGSVVRQELEGEER